MFNKIFIILYFYCKLCYNFLVNFQEKSDIMKASRMLISTLKEAPVEAKIASHTLLLRAGFIKGLVAGVYNYLPFGLKVLNKIETIIREEMNRSGAIEILSSAVQPKELWEESGRWSKYGAELFRFSDRHEREFCLGPTHEEIFTSMARDLIKSPKQLPMNIYQIQTKYRDEARPRFGLMRGREFIMKDSYSFDKDEQGLEESYQIMYDTYSRIFKRLGLDFRAVLADTGAIGGNGSHQFMAFSEAGESDVVYCDKCGYAADVEKADAVCTIEDNSPLKELEYVETPNVRTIEELEKFFEIPSNYFIKCVVYKETERNEVVVACVKGDREVNEIKLVNALNTSEAFLTLATEDDIRSIGSVPGFVGPFGLNCKVLIDNEVAQMKNTIAGGNKLNFHVNNINFVRDFNGEVIDLRKAVEGDLCPCCKEPMKMRRGIEVGQIFKLGTKYSLPMKCNYTNNEGKNVPMVMGCYGIGVTRTMSAIVEQYHDEFGIKWPLNVAPYHAVVLGVSQKDEAQVKLSNDIYNELLNNRCDTILDDRDGSLGFKMKDWELIGIPYIIICGKKTVDGIVEVKNRLTGEKQEMTSTDAINLIIDTVKNI